MMDEALDEFLFSELTSREANDPTDAWRELCWYTLPQRLAEVHL
jgi:hypothetical protein